MGEGIIFMVEYDLNCKEKVMENNVTKERISLLAKKKVKMKGLLWLNM